MRVLFESCRGAALTAALLLLMNAESAHAQKNQDSKPNLDSIQAIDQHYQDRLQGLERDRLKELANLASRQKGDDAEKTYRHLLSLAIVSNQYQAASSAAEAYLKRESADPQTQAMAAFVAAMGETSQDHADKAVETLTQFLKGPSAKKIDADLLRGLGESFLQSLLVDDRSETAAKVARAFAESAPASVQEHFASRLDQIERIGQDAPEIATEDIDGRPVSLDKLSGKVVLVSFWATWCSPCASTTPHLNDLYDRYHDQGFEILGVSVDPRRKGESVESSRSAVRQFLIDYFVPWTAVLNGEGKNDFAKAYGVTEIPANFLVDQKGKIARIDLHGQVLDQAVANLLGVEPPADSQTPQTGSTSGSTEKPKTQPIEPPK